MKSRTQQKLRTLNQYGNRYKISMKTFVNLLGLFKYCHIIWNFAYYFDSCNNLRLLQILFKDFIQKNITAEKKIVKLLEK